MKAALYRPLHMAAGVAGGIIAGVIFKQVWKVVAGEEEAPEATSREYSWGEVLVAAAIQGAIFAVVKAAVDRGGAVGVRKLTGEWPD
jgi:predicted metal-dependent enzyme (double-stranded beta helix superfamily)